MNNLELLKIILDMLVAVNEYSLNLEKEISVLKRRIFKLELKNLNCMRGD